MNDPRTRLEPHFTAQGVGFPADERVKEDTIRRPEPEVVPAPRQAWRQRQAAGWTGGCRVLRNADGWRQIVTSGIPSRSCAIRAPNAVSGAAITVCSGYVPVFDDLERSAHVVEDQPLGNQPHAGDGVPERGVPGDRLILGFGPQLDKVEPGLADDRLEMRIGEQGDSMAASLERSAEPEERKHIARGTQRDEQHVEQGVFPFRGGPATRSSAIDHARSANTQSGRAGLDTIAMSVTGFGRLSQSASRNLSNIAERIIFCTNR